MKINLIQKLVIATLIITGYCLHLQQQPRIYDPQKYYDSMKVTQDQLKSDLLAIQSQFAKLDQALKNAADDPNQQLKLYQEGIADQRDSLYQIQQYLNLPFNLRACKCFGFSDALRQNLTQQLAKVSQSLDNVEQQAQKCVDCIMNQQIVNEINQQKMYLKIMQDTVDAKCCKVYKILYVDNLNNSNWLSGNYTPEEYTAWINEKIAQNSANDTIIKVCPIFSPFTSDNLESCSACQNQNQLFNLATRVCQECPSGKIFNYQTHKCDYNYTCPSGTVFNEQTVMCERLEPAFNHSFCPPTAPVWNQQLLGCFKCNKQTPFYDINTGTCTTCPSSYIYNPNTNQCVHPSCVPGQIYNQLTKICQNGTSYIDTSTNSHCPSDRPFWDKASLSCSRCPADRPFYNTTSKSCEQCPQGSTYDATRNTCVKQCPQGYQLNQITFQCQNITQPVPTIPTGNQISMCPPNRPNWNPQSKSCSTCPTDFPNFNTQTQRCQKCVQGQNYNTGTGLCQGTTTVVVQEQCPVGTVLNQITRKCDRVGGTMAHCPPERPMYNVIAMACSACPYDRPVYDPSINDCKAGTSVSGTTPTTGTPVVTQTCPQGTYFDSSSQTCKVVSTTNMIQCPPNSYWDASKLSCIASTSGIQNATNPVTTSECPFNYQWDGLRSQCVQCQIYQKYNPSSKLCQNFCKPGQFYNSNLEICSKTASNCPVGQVFNQAKLLCVCPQGLNYRYNTNNNACQLYCKQNEQYSIIDGSCRALF